jgi:hypothetical protein
VLPMLLARAKRNDAYMLCPLAGNLRVTNLLTAIRASTCFCRNPIFEGEADSFHEICQAWTRA